MEAAEDVATPDLDADMDADVDFYMDANVDADVVKDTSTPEKYHIQERSMHRPG